MGIVSKLTKEELLGLVAESNSTAEVCRKLGISENGGSATRLRQKIVQLGIDISHWSGQAWNRGKTRLDDKRICSWKDVEKIFSADSDVSSGYVRSLVVKKQLIACQCKECGITETWNGKPLTLQLDHINGDRRDQRLENLRWLCPNCHSQTNTFCSKNIKSRTRVANEDLLRALLDAKSVRAGLSKCGLDDGKNYLRAYRLIEKYGPLGNWQTQLV